MQQGVLCELCSHGMDVSPGVAHCTGLQPSQPLLMDASLELGAPQEAPISLSLHQSSK